MRRFRRERPREGRVVVSWVVTSSVKVSLDTNNVMLSKCKENIEFSFYKTAAAAVLGYVSIVDIEGVQYVVGG